MSSSPSSSWSWWPFRREMHRNVKLILSAEFFLSLSGSIAFGTFLSAFLLKMTGHSNAKVGAIEAVQGVSELAAALPVGMYADKIGKSRVCKFAMILALAAPCILVAAILLGGTSDDRGGRPWPTNAAALFVAGLALDGVVFGIFDGPMDALLADSVRSGQRSIVYAWRQFASHAGRIGGPAVTIIFFTMNEDAWLTPEVVSVIVIGLALSLPSTILTMFLTEADADGDFSARRSGSSTLLAPDGPSKEGDGAGGSARIVTERTPLVSDASGDGGAAGEMDRLADCGAVDSPGPHKYAYAIPYIMFVSDLINGIGSGMTIKFVPLWWKEDLHMTPVQVQQIYLISPVTSILFGFISVWMSKRIGRAITCMLSAGTGSVLLVLLVYLYRIASPIPLLVAIFVLRNACANAYYPGMFIREFRGPARAREREREGYGRGSLLVVFGTIVVRA